MSSFVPTHYQSYYCEENIWWLNQHPELIQHPRVVVFITNAGQSVALGAQRAGGDDGVVIWDYHVVLAALESEWMIYDLDSTAGIRQPATTWLAHSVGLFHQLPERFVAGFRPIPGEVFHTEFSSNRHHMRTADNGWVHAPPSWSPIGNGHSLTDFIDPANQTYGPLMTAESLIKSLNKNKKES